MLSFSIYYLSYLLLLQGIVSQSGREYRVIPCTHRAVFDSSLPTLTGAATVVTSVLSNFLCDSCLVVDPGRLLDVANTELQGHVSALLTFLQSHPDVHAVVVPPLPRLKPDWFNPYLPCFSTFLANAISSSGNVRLHLLAPIIALPSSFETDGVHLNAEAGISFIQYVLNGVDQILSGAMSTSIRPLPSSTMPSVPTVPASGFTSLASSSSLTDAFATLSTLTNNLQVEVTSRRLQDNLIFARLKEDQDYALNKNREDRFTVSGLQLSQAPPKDALERKAFFKDLLTSMVLEACPDLVPQPQVLDVFVNMRYGRGPPFLEARLDSAASSSAFRIAAAKLSKVEDSRFANLFIANSVTLTTRVRIEILRALAKLLTTDTEEAYVQSFTSRPMLHYQSKEGVQYPLPGTNRSYSFVEAVGKWGSSLTTTHLLPAYRRARPAFIGCLEQYFVVLKESEPSEVSSGFDQLFPTGSNAYPLRGAPGRGSRPVSRRPLRIPRVSFAGRGRVPTPVTIDLTRPTRNKRPASDAQVTPSKRRENFDENATQIEETSATAATAAPAAPAAPDVQMTEPNEEPSAESSSCLTV